MPAKRKAKAKASSLESRTIRMEPLSIRADVVPASLNDTSRTVDVVFGTEAPVERFDWREDVKYLEVLSMDPEHVRLDRLNKGASVLDSHNADSVLDVLGAVVPDSARMSQKQGIAKLRFSDREDVEPVWRDVKSGILGSVSFAYRVYKFEETVEDNALPIRKAIDWEPFEISMVPVPADAGARVREDAGDTNLCVIERSEEKAMTVKAKPDATPEPENDPTQSESILETNPLDAPEERSAPPPAEPSDRDVGVSAERDRITGIRLACRAGRVPPSFEDKLITDGTSLVKAQAAVLDEIRKRGDDDRGPGSKPPDIRVGDDPFLHVRAGIENAILSKLWEKKFPLEDVGRRYRGMSMFDIASSFLRARGVRTTEMSRMEIAGMALGLTRGGGGLHTTSDFPILLEDVARKMLRAAYAERPQNFSPIARRKDLPDFRPNRMLQFGNAPQLLQVNEHGEFTRGTIGESKETWQLASFGRIFGITRQALVNDDTDAFSQVPQKFGRSARTLEMNTVWAIITANAAMSDTFALFSTEHLNLDAAPSVISIASISKGRAAMRVQKDLDGETLLDLNPEYLIVPAALETVAQQFVSNNLSATTSSAVNIFAGTLEVIVEPRLDADSVTAWYLAAGADQVDTLVYGSLEGDGGPSIETRIGFDIDGIEIKARHDFAAKAVDYRGLWKNPGA